MSISYTPIHLPVPVLIVQYHTTALLDISSVSVDLLPDFVLYNTKFPTCFLCPAHGCIPDGAFVSHQRTTVQDPSTTS